MSYYSAGNHNKDSSLVFSVRPKLQISKDRPRVGSDMEKLKIAKLVKFANSLVKIHDPFKAKIQGF